MSESMFGAACQHITVSAGKKSLHPSKDLNSADRFQTLCIVKRKKSFWFWKKPKMIPTQMTLQNLLIEQNVFPETAKSFTLLENFMETPTFNVHGKICAKIASELSIDLSGSDTMNLTITLGDIAKHEISWQTLQEFLQTNKVNLSHQLFREIRKSKRTTLCIVLESLLTKADSKLAETTDATISTDDKETGKSVVAIEVTESGSLEHKNAHSFIIPQNTVLAYSCNELAINKDGIASVHTVVDRLDDVDEPLFLIEQTVQDPIDDIRSKLQPLIKSDNFEQLRNGCKLILPSMSHESLEALHLLLSTAEESLEDSSETKSMSLSDLSQIFKAENVANEALYHILIHLGFIIEDKKVNGEVFFPSKDKEQIVKSMLGLVDALSDFDFDARKFLSNITPVNLKRVLSVVQKQLHGEDTSKKSVMGLFQNDPSIELFLKNIGFIEMVADDDELLCFPERSNLILRDVYAVIYVLSMTE